MSRLGRVVNLLLLTFFQVILIGCMTPAVRYVRASDAVSTSDSSVTLPPVNPGDERLFEVVRDFMGIPYKYGGQSRDGMDCSGFVGTVYGEVYGVKLPRSSHDMRNLGQPVPVQQVRAGDLLLFRGRYSSRINHVGIFMGEGRFAHSSTSSGVTYSSMDEDYYKKRLVGIRRVAQ